MATELLQRSLSRDLVIASLPHHERMLEAWTHKRFMLEYVIETARLFALPLNLIPGKRVLDVGSGIGARVASLRLMGVDAYGLELDKRVVESSVPEARRFNFQGSLLDINLLLKIRPQYIISDDVFEHLTLGQIRKFLAITKHLGVKEMVHSITTLEHTKDIHNDPTHLTKLSSENWRNLLNSKCWSVVGNSRVGHRFGVFHLVRS